MATQIPADRVLVFLAAWDGRYYWDYPNYSVSDAHGRRGRIQAAHQRRPEARLQDDADVRHQLGERKLPVWPKIAGGVTKKIDGNDVQSQLGGLEQRPPPGRLARPT